MRKLRAQLFDRRAEADDAAARLRERFALRVEAVEVAVSIDDDLQFNVSRGQA